ncbi:MAG: hypothetical protein U0800_26365 [Isosphaeraceae bacterium]
MSKWVVAGAMFLGCVVAMTGLSLASPPDEATKKVMKDAMKSGLYKKVVSGKGSGEDKKELLDLFETLAKSKPAKGGEGDWKNKTGALLEAAKEAAEDKPTASAKLKTAGDCKSCHDAHK